MLKTARVHLAIGAGLAAIFAAAPSHAAPAGPYAKLCETGKSAVLARINGFKSARGVVSVKLYPGNNRFLEKGAYLRKVEVPVTRTGPMEICVPVPASGRYALSVRHEVTGEKSRSDGGGFSGNPKVSLMDVILKRKPNLERVAFTVNGTTRLVPVTLYYLEGASLRPAA